MYLPRSILLLIIYKLVAASAGSIRRRQLQGERIDYIGGATDLRGGSRVDPENAGLLELAALRKVVLDGKCSGVCDVTSNSDWVCADENSHLVCHQGKTNCIPAVSFHKHCLNHDDTCGPCTDAGESECGTCNGQGECEFEEVEICHKKQTRCVSSESWLGHCYNHGDTCGACPSIIEEDEGGEDGGVGDDAGDDAGEDEGNESGEPDISACAAPCSQEDSPALQRCAEESPNLFPICHKGRNTLCVGPNAWPGHCLRHSDTCGPCSVPMGEASEAGTEADSASGVNENGNGGNGTVNIGNGNGNNGDGNGNDGNNGNENSSGSGNSGNGDNPPENSNAGGNGNGSNDDEGDGDEDEVESGNNGKGPPDNSNAGGNGNGNGGNGNSGNNEIADENSADDEDPGDESTTGGGSGNTR